MNKTELIAAVAKKAELKNAEAAKAVAAILETVTETLVKGEKVQIIGFGSFEVRQHAAREARNPRTGEAIKIKASKSPAFKAGKALKDSVNVSTKKKK